MFLAFRVLPRKVSDQTLSTLANANRSIRRGVEPHVARLVARSRQGILVVNRKYIEMWRPVSGGREAGLHGQRTDPASQNTGSFFGDVDQYCADIDAAIAQDVVTSSIIETTDGRFIHLVNQPMPDGGWVATHEDITERHNLLRAHDNAERGCASRN
jgi:hypothetical protein